MTNRTRSSAKRKRAAEKRPAVQPDDLEIEEIPPTPSKTKKKKTREVADQIPVVEDAGEDSDSTAPAEPTEENQPSGHPFTDGEWGRASNRGHNQQPPAVNNAAPPSPSAATGEASDGEEGGSSAEEEKEAPSAVPPPQAIKNADVATPPASQVSSRRRAPPRSAAAAVRGRYSELEIEGEEDAVAKDSESKIFGSSTGRRGSGRGRGRGRGRWRGRSCGQGIKGG